MIERLQNVSKAMALVFAIPIAALVISYFVSMRYDTEFREALVQANSQQSAEIDLSQVEDYRSVCERASAELGDLCDPADELALFEQGAKISFGVGVVLFVILFSGRLIAGSNRTRLAFVLSPLTRLILIGLSISIVLQGSLFVYGIYIAEAVFIHRVHFVALAVAGLIALFGGLNLVAISMKLMKGASFPQAGILVDHFNGQNLIDLVHDVAASVGAKRPDHVLIGLEPSFYVTAADVAIEWTDKVLKGTTLYMPLPFLRLLTKAELRAVIGHEMGHFKGRDTDYSLKFYPAYSRLGSAIQSLAGNEGDSHVVNLPTLFFLVLLQQEFSGAERKIGREREIRADSEGAKVESAKALATALLKFSEYGQLWGPIRGLNIDELNRGRIVHDICQLYSIVASRAHENIDFTTKLSELLSYEMAHPNDTHPTLRERFDALGIDVSCLTKDDIAPADEDVTALISDYSGLTEQLSMAEHRLMIGLGHATLPEQQEVEEGAAA